jgi:Flp pilus assembly protein CpaB
MGQIVVSKVDIPAGTDLNELIKDDQFRINLILEDAVVDGSVTSIDQLKGRQSRVRILAGEQIAEPDRGRVS